MQPPSLYEPKPLFMSLQMSVVLTVSIIDYTKFYFTNLRGKGLSSKWKEDS